MTTRQGRPQYINARLGDIFDVLIGGTPSRSEPEYWDESKQQDNIWVSIRDLSQLRKREIGESTERITDKGVAASNVKLIPAQTALMTFKLTIGKTAVTSKPLYTNEAIAAFLPKSGTKVDPYYLAELLPLLNYDVDRAVKGKTLNKEKIKAATIPLVSFETQKYIAGVLQEVDQAILATQELIDQTNLLKLALVQKLFEKHKNVSLGSYATITTGTTPPTNNRTYYVGKNAYVKTTHIDGSSIGETNTFISDEAKTKFRLKTYAPKTILLAMYGQGKTRGNASILAIPASTSQNAAAIETHEALNPEYLWQYLRSQYDNLRGEGVHGHIAHLNIGFVKRLQIPLPQPAEQERISNILAAIDKKIDVCESIKAAQKQLRYGLAQDLLPEGVSL